MTCPRCGQAIADGISDCPHCGIVIAKFLKRQAGKESASSVQSADNERSFLADLLLPEPSEVNPLVFGAKIFLLLILIVWGTKLFLSPITGNAAGKSFMHLINLPFHEAGHIIFRPFGRLIASLGGTLGQILIPAVCLGVLLIKTRDAFGASVALWWFGESFIDIAPYIHDARSLTLPLLGGNTGDSSPYGFHDWEFILTELGLINFDRAIAVTAKGIGGLLMLAACAWGAVLLFRQYQYRQQSG